MPNQKAFWQRSVTILTLKRILSIKTSEYGQGSLADITIAVFSPLACDYYWLTGVRYKSAVPFGGDAVRARGKATLAQGYFLIYGGLKPSTSRRRFKSTTQNLNPIKFRAVISPDLLLQPPVATPLRQTRSSSLGQEQAREPILTRDGILPVPRDDSALATHKTLPSWGAASSKQRQPQRWEDLDDHFRAEQPLEEPGQEHGA
jgi:hypothetical protein